MARPLFHFVHRSDFLQHHGGPLGIAGLLVARVSCGSGRKDGVGLLCNVDGEAFAEGEERITLYSLNDTHGVPHPLSRIAVACHIHLLDGVAVSPRHVGDDLLGGVFHGLPHLHR